MNKTIEFINSKTGNFKPEIGIILGSGLGELADEYCDKSISYTATRFRYIINLFDFRDCMEEQSRVSDRIGQA